MKLLGVLLISVFCFSFYPIVDEPENSSKETSENSSTEAIVSTTGNGFYIYVEDFTNRTNHKYIVQTKDSVQNIFNYFFESELALGNVDRPITIFNGKRNFYIARVTVFRKPNGEMDFRHLKYNDPYVKPDNRKRQQIKPVTL